MLKICYKVRKVSYKMNRKQMILEKVHSGELTPKDAAYQLKQLISDVKFYSEQWIEQSIIRSYKERNELRKILIFCDSKKRNEFETAFAGAECIYVYKADYYMKESEWEYYVNPVREADYEQLFNEITQGRIDLDAILHLWALDERTDERPEEIGLSVLNIGKQVLKSMLSKDMPFIHVYSLDKEETIASQSAVYAIFTSLKEEAVRLKGKSIAIDSDSQKKYIEIVKEELGEVVSQHVQYYSGRRYIKSYKSLALKNHTSIIQNNGYYLISGGAGALGRTLSEFIQNEGGHVIWCGRRSLRDIPDGIEYYVCNTANREQVMQMEQELQRKKIILNGIFVCNGSINDSLLKNKDMTHAKELLSGKLQAVQNIDEVFAEHPLDFFIMYSSIAAHIPSMGQSDYAFANAFLESFAEYRARMQKKGLRNGRVLCIAWPFFQNGGMKVNPASIEYMKNAKGLIPLNAEQQYELIQKMYDADENSIVILCGDPSILVNNQGEEKQWVLQVETQDSDLLALTVKKLKEFAAEILHEEMDVFKDEEKFSNYGFDSITSIEFINAVNQYFNLKVMPSVLFEYTKFSTLSKYLVEKYRNELVIANKSESQELDNKVVVEDICSNNNNDKYPVNNQEEVRLAIVGMAGRFPKSSNLEELWKHLVNQDDLVTTIPDNRWDWKEYWSDSGDDAQKTNVIWGGFMNDVDMFDEKIFGISRREADYMNPQQRILLETVWQVFEDAGYKPSDLRSTNIGVFVGTAGSEYNDICTKNNIDISPYSSMGLSHAIDANRVSYYFDLHGPSESIDTACSSSLVALNRAINAIKNGECTEAVVAGVNVILTPSLYIAFDKAGMLSKTGKCSAFDEEANGFVRGEGVGAVYIKPLKNALENRDHIYGIIRGSGVNHGGDASSLTAPNTSAQKELIRNVYTSSNVPFDTVSYIETHGTGTVLGDSVEVNALCSVYKDLCPIENNNGISCGLGSIKTNMGHLETAAGIAGVIKVLLCMKYDLIPGNINFKKQSKMINLDSTPFYIQKDNTPWLRRYDINGDVIPRRAGISSFGFGGTNSHVILEDYKPKECRVISSKYIMLPVSAPTKEQLLETVRKLCDYITHHEEVDLDDVAYTLQNGREEYPIRYVVCAKDRQDIIAYMDSFMDGVTSNGYFGNASSNVQREVIEFTGSEELPILEEICKKWVNGANVLWSTYYENTDVRRVALPGYEFQKNKHWVKYGKETCNKAKLYSIKKEWKTIDNINSSGIENVIILCDKNQKDSLDVKQIENVSAIVTPDCIDSLIFEKETKLLDIRNGEDIDEFFDSVFKCFQFILSKTESFQYIYAFSTTDTNGRMRADALDGFCHSLWTESGEGETSKFRYQLMGYSEISILNTNRTCRNEYVIYESDRCLKQCLKLTPIGAPEIETFKRLKQDGKYIIFGGTGGIGQITVRYILDHTNGTVILVGRSEQKDIIKMFSDRYGERIDYFKADIGNVDNVRELRTYVLTKYGSINGIIHSAGLNRDGLLYSKKWEDYHSVLQVKIRGCLNIEEVFGLDYIDFMLLYTSVAAYYGNAGQTDYCLANLFMEAYANERNQRVKDGKAYGETIYIAWPFWKNTGMKTPEIIQKRIYQKYGMLPIEEPHGVSILDGVLQGRKESSGYVYGEKIKLPELIKEEQEVHSSKVISVSLMDNIVDYIIEILKKLVGAERINLDTTLEELCIDSIIVAQFTERIQKDIGEIEKTILFECNNVEEVAIYMLENYEVRFRKHFSDKYDRENEDDNHTTSLQDAECQINLGEEENQNNKEDIAIIGFDGKFASADSIDELWEHLACGDDLTQKVPEDRWNNDKYFSNSVEQAEDGKYYCQNAGFINKVDEFDPLFFHISPKEAELMDPQERMLLEIAWNTVEKSGYNKESIKRLLENEVGVFVGITTHTYNMIGGEELYKGNANIAKSESWSIANRISYFMNWKGPSLAVDTACSSSLTALHYACKSLQEHEAKMVFVGGVNIYLHPVKFIYMCQMRMLSESGISSPFGENADGFVPGEGVGGMLLKTLKQARKDGDKIYGIIKGTAVNHDGMTNGYTVPNVKEQAKVIKNSLIDADVNPETISYVEAHGTGTRLGDPIEIAGLRKAWSEYTNRKQYCAIGSIKGNIGHLEGCAGIASVIKVLLQFQHKQLLPSIHSETLNSRINFSETPFYVQHDLMSWEPKDENQNPILRRAAVSSFGAGGTNVHVILEEYDRDCSNDRVDCQEEQVFTLSARNRKQLEEYAKRVQNYLKSHSIETQDRNTVSCSMDNTSSDVVLKLADLLDVPANVLSETETLDNYGMDRILLEQYKQILENSYGENKGIESITLEWSLGKILRCLSGGIQNDESEKLYNIKYSDFIYTSHRREAFDERMIIIAKDFKELEEGLKSYICNPYISTRNVIVHNVKNEPLPDVPEWLNGATNEWKDYDRNAEILDLPTYPFANKRYWAPIVKEVSNHLDNKILDENLSTFTRHAYSKRFTKKCFYLSDHVVNGVCTLPGVFYLQMAHEAAMKSLSEKSVVLNDITWLKPLIVNEDEVQATIELERSDAGCSFKVLSADGIHMQGRSVISKNEESKQVDISMIQSRCYESIPVEKFYHDFENMGIHYGRSFQAVKQVSYGQLEILSEIDLPSCACSLSEYPIHPSLLDAALQTTSMIKEMKWKNENRTFIPFEVKEFRLDKPLQENCYVYVQKIKAENGMVTCDIHILDKNGNQLGYLKEFSFRVLDKGLHTNKLSEEVHYYSTGWKPSQVMDTKEGNKTILVFYDGEKVAAPFAKGKQIIWIHSGSGYKKCSNNEYQLCPYENSDYEKLLHELLSEGVQDFDIIHFWSDKFIDMKEEQYADYIKYGIQSVFLICKAIVNSKQDLNVALYLVNRLRNESQNPFFTAINGFLKTIHLEHGMIQAKSIQIDENDNEIWAKLSEELQYVENNMEIRYQNGVRKVKEIEKIFLNKRENTGFDTRNGVYFITGALGGLSRIMIQKICQVDNDVKFILTDILPVGVQSNELIDNIRRCNKEAIYISADLNSEEQVKQVVQRGKERFGEITYLIHTAGNIQDEIFRKKKFEVFKKIMGPKVYGTLNLDKATKQEQLKAIVLFSSVAAFGNAGQCDYSFANDFLVRFGEHRNYLAKEGKRSGKTIVMNWPLWSNGGMKTDKQTEELFQHFGMRPLDSDLGMKALDISMANDVHQVVVTQGNHELIFKKLQSMFKIREDIMNKNQIQATSIEVKYQFTEKIKEIMCELLKLQEEIDLSIDISDYGFDSISITDLVNRINNYYCLDLLPTNVFEYNTIQKFVDGVYKSNQKKLCEYYADNESEEVSSDINEDKQIEEVDMKVEIASGEKHNDDPIAVIGMSCKLPGADNVEEFWSNLIEGKCINSEIPSDRWNWREVYGDSHTESNKTYVKNAAFVDGIDLFDEELFGITKREAIFMDPVQRMVIEETHRAIEDAGIKHSALRDSDTGVYIGLVSMEYYEKVTNSMNEIDPFLSTGNSRAVTANRISYVYSLRGPSEVIDTACSSSIVAVERAIDDIRLGKCTMAIVGGVNAILSSQVHLAYSRTGMLCQDGKCKTFDESADGYGRGEGCGVMILKPLSKAIENHDPIHCLIIGGGVNHTGHVNNLTTPNPVAQNEVIEIAVRKSGVPFRSIGFIETHGTGTKLGDPIEITGILNAEKHLNAQHLPHPCVLGAVKSNIGHLEGAAGIAGMIKAAKALEENTIPANVNFSKLNSFIKLDGTEFSIARQTQQFPIIRDEMGHVYPRRAGVSSFGFSGVNAHIIMEAYERNYDKVSESNVERVFVLSARTQELLTQYINMMQIWIHKKKEQDENSDLWIKNMIYTLQEGKDPQACRIAIVFNGIEELENKLDNYNNLGEEQGVYRGTIEKNNKSSLILISSMSDEQLAREYVTNCFLDWKPCYSDEPQKISIPARPLKRNSCWFQQKEQSKPLSYVISKRISIPVEMFKSKETFEKDMGELERYCAILIINEFAKKGYFIHGNETYTLSDFVKILKVRNNYLRLLTEIIEILHKHGYLKIEGDKLITTDSINEVCGQNIEDLRNRFEDAHSGIVSHIYLLNHCIPHLFEIMEGQTLATDILFPNSSMDLVKPVYGDNPGADYYNRLVVEAVVAYVEEIRENEPNRTIRILEVGAGTGGTSKDVLYEISKKYQNITYMYTDMSNAFLNYGRTMYGRRYDFMEFGLLNVEKDPIEQGFVPYSYDIVIGANVFHATKNLRTVMEHMKMLLRSSGWMVVNEITSIQAFLTLTFGLTDGWWLYEDEDIRLKGGPLLSYSNWEKSLIELGFESVAGVDSILSGRIVPQEVIIARNTAGEAMIFDVSNVETKTVETGKPVENATTNELLETEKNSACDLNQYVQVKIVEAISETLMVDSSSIDINEPYSSYGVDSILGAECVNAINKALDISLDTTELFNRTDIVQLAAFICERFYDNLIQRNDMKSSSYEDELSIMLSKYQNGEIDMEEILYELETTYGEE